MMQIEGHCLMQFIHDRTQRAKTSLHDRETVEIAAIHPGFE